MMKRRMCGMGRQLSLLCIMALCAFSSINTVQGTEVVAQAPNLTAVSMQMTNRERSGNNVLLPVLTGHPDAAIQDKISATISQRLQVEELLRTLDRVAAYSGDEGRASGIHMEGRAMVIGPVLSLTMSTRGELPGGRRGQLYNAFVYDLTTGTALTLADLFSDPEASFARMEEIVEAAVSSEGLNTYMENASVTPVPRDNFSVDARGITVYYPADQYSMVTGNCGAFVFPYYQLEAMMADTPICSALLSQRPKTEKPGEEIIKSVAGGAFPNLPIQLGQPVAAYVEKYPLLHETDYTLDGPIYQFETPLLQGIRLISPMYPEGMEQGELGNVIAIRISGADVYGLRTGVTTLEETLTMLGEPVEQLDIDEETAMDMLLSQGTSYLYPAGEYQLEVHGNLEGIVDTLILHAAAE